MAVRLTFRRYEIPEEWQRRYALLGGGLRKGFVAELPGKEQLLVMFWKEGTRTVVGATVITRQSGRRHPSPDETNLLSQAMPEWELTRDESTEPHVLRFTAQRKELAHA